MTSILDTIFFDRRSQVAPSLIVQGALGATRGGRGALCDRGGLGCQIWTDKDERGRRLLTSDHALRDKSERVAISLYSRAVSLQSE